MSEARSERRVNPNPADVGGYVAISYTIGFLTLAVLLYFYPIPTTNKDALLYLFGILSGIELQIIAFYFGGNKNAEATQRATEQRQGRSAAVVEQLAVAKVAPQPTVTPAATNPETGIVPAAEVATQPPKELKV